MRVELERVEPAAIEVRSFEIIREELPHPIDEKLAPVILRVIHATADFDYVDSLFFSEDSVDAALQAIRDGAAFVTDTTMALSGINKAALMRHGCEAFCFIGDDDVARSAAERGTTRSAQAMEKAAKLDRPLIFAIGNAPTALVRLYELIREGRIAPRLVIGVPVGFVNVVQAKELLMSSGVPCIVARGRKGGSSVAAAICNALLYMLGR